MAATLIPIERMDSCLYLSEAHQKHLFGSNYEMQILRPRPGMKGQFLYKETVRVLGAKDTSLNVSLYGPPWEQSSLELSKKDAKALGISAPEHASGELRKSASCTLQGPAGVVELKEGVISPTSSLYCSPEAAAQLGVAQDQRVRLCLADQPRVMFEDVSVRVHPTYALLFHVSSVDAQSSKVRDGMMAQLVIS